MVKDTTVTFWREPKEGRPKISKKDEVFLNGYLGRDVANQIDLNETHLLTEETGMEIWVLQAGADNLKSLTSTVHFKSLVTAVRAEMSPAIALHQIPAVAIAKVLSLRI